MWSEKEMVDAAAYEFAEVSVRAAITHDFLQPQSMRPIHTGREHAILQAIPLMLLTCSVDTPICNSRFHLLAFAPAHPVWIGPSGHFEQILQQFG